MYIYIYIYPPGIREGDGGGGGPLRDELPPLDHPEHLQVDVADAEALRGPALLHLPPQPARALHRGLREVYLDARLGDVRAGEAARVDDAAQARGVGRPEEDVVLAHVAHVLVLVHLPHKGPRLEVHETCKYRVGCVEAAAKVAHRRRHAPVHEVAARVGEALLLASLEARVAPGAQRAHAEAVLVVGLALLVQQRPVALGHLRVRAVGPRVVRQACKQECIGTHIYIYMYIYIYIYIDIVLSLLLSLLLLLVVVVVVVVVSTIIIIIIIIITSTITITIISAAGRRGSRPRRWARD